MNVTYDSVAVEKHRNKNKYLLYENIGSKIRYSWQEMLECPCCHSKDITFHNWFESGCDDMSEFKSYYFVGKCNDCESTYESDPFVGIDMCDNIRYDYDDKNEFILSDYYHKVMKSIKILLTIGSCCLLAAILCIVLLNFNLFHGLVVVALFSSAATIFHLAFFKIARYMDAKDNLKSAKKYQKHYPGVKVFFKSKKEDNEIIEAIETIEAFERVLDVEDEF